LIFRGRIGELATNVCNLARNDSRLVNYFDYKLVWLGSQR